MVLVAITLALSSILGSITPVLIARALDIIKVDAALLSMLLLSLALIALGSLGWFFNYIRSKITTRIIGEVVVKLQEDVFERTISHDLSFFDQHPAGKIVSRITSDTQDFTQIVNLVIDLISQFLQVFVLLVWLFVINATLSLVMLAMAPVAILITITFRKIARQVTRHSKRVTATINSQIQESINGIMVAKAFRQENALFRQFSTNNKHAYTVGLRRGIVINVIFPLINISGTLSTALIMYLAGAVVKQGGMTPGTWYLFMQTVGFFWWPLLNIASFWNQFQDGLSAAERVFALVDREPKVKQHSTYHPTTLKGKIDFQNVLFAYKETEQVLNNFSLLIQPGETVALVGHTGAGKSSIARLIARFYEFQGGQILIDDRDIRSYDLQAYLHFIGLVPQDPFLFSGTVKENIRYGKPEATDADVLYAATHVGSGEWLQDLNNGLDTDVGHRGSSLSMGQRQLVALARVLLKNPAIFVLDEATASVDPFTEYQIQEGLASVMQARTALVIAHRLSTVEKADRILVIDQGRIIEEGSHTALLARGGHYATLYNTYFRHQSLDYIGV